MNLSEMKRKAKEKGFGDITEIIAEGLVLHSGWEMDNDCWLVKMKDGQLRLFTTNHGSFYPMSDADLESSIRVAEESLESLQIIRNKLLNSRAK